MTSLKEWFTWKPASKKRLGVHFFIILKYKVGLNETNFRESCPQTVKLNELIC